MVHGSTVYIRDRRDKNKIIKDAIFAFSGGEKSLLIKGEGQEISTAVEVAEIIKNRMFPGVEIANVSLGSRPFYQRRDRQGQYNRYNKKNQSNYKKNNNDIISKIEILLRAKQLM